ncbi:MAG TPA: hypothetical protein VH107_14040 [Lacipirellulaceae bacterium]|jgi:hypothetical protein|nr:hypothetical protein [Lacipirellulaceae bacterium]
MPVKLPAVTEYFPGLLGLSGRVRIVLPSIFIVAALIIAEVTLSQLLLMPDSRHLVDVSFATTLGGLVLLGAGWAIIAARRRQLISRFVEWTAVSTWIVATIATCVIRFPWSAEPWGLTYLLVAVVTALAVLPIATMPLAVCLNRHR